MNDRNILRVAKLLRPVVRRRTPVLYRLAMWTARAVCPRGTSANSRELIAPFEGGLIHVDTSSSIEYHILFRGCHEPVVTRELLARIKPGDVCLDVGANVGAHTLVMARLAGPVGRVVAVEPHPDLAGRLERNLRLNNYAQVQVVRAALSDQDGRTTFYGVRRDAFNQGTSGLLPTAEADVAMEVETICGATLQARTNLTRCDFIKIDVEGFESVVLAQLRGLIDASRPALTFEYRHEHWSRFGHSLDEVLGWLRALGYTFATMGKKRVTPFTLPAPESCEILALPPAAD